MMLGEHPYADIPLRPEVIEFWTSNLSAAYVCSATVRKDAAKQGLATAIERAATR